MEPLVSVVIPTYRRPQLVKRAVMSALAQTLKEIEVIVVIDGPQPETQTVLSEIDDSRLRAIELPTNQGCRVARNTGIAAASAKWVASLDDDDEWMPQKLEMQLETARLSQYKFPIISCYLKAQTPQGDSIWPRRFPQPSEALSEYLFVRKTLFQGEGLIQSSTIFTAKELLEKVPFSTTIQRHDDWDWILRAMSVEGVGVEFVPEVLSIWYIGDARPTLSSSNNWQFSLDWIRAKRDLVTPRAYSSFILAEVSARAARTRDWKAFFLLLWEAIRFGRPQLTDIFLCLGMWLIPTEKRTWLRLLLTKKPKPLPNQTPSEGSGYESVGV
ncbi:glycosyl transferase [Scytonema hofmannii PCC 7110]|uniref:Glycosyl transferase n=1 Tax=Scytonema hofmannii PCC 7110 TaxID=128403 RepID=A0A139WSS2_9CYAN|nr:glycosyltransferase [Scytonema hofmannii]KYC35494.1 glycosyl transferase [Scytonema hofmannii PCC 7110]